MASVWCAHDRVLGRDVAVKLLAEQFAHDQSAIRRFKREARAAARLSGHPHVVTIYDVGEAAEHDDQGRRAFIVMEYLAGGTVADALRVNELDRDEALRWLHEAASALDYAHGRGVVHRDIKPANFLLSSNRVLYVADFGIARVGTEDTITSTGYMLGTAAYLAPERALGHPATEASDRYALAVVAFELLTRERPFAAEHFAAQAQLHVEQPVPSASSRNPYLPKAVDAVLARGMAKQPEERWPTAQGFVDTLELALTEHARRRGRRVPIPVAAPALAAPATVGGHPPPVEFMRMSAGRRVPRWLIPVAALASVALAVGIVVGAGHTGASRPHVTASAPPRHTVTHKARPAHHRAQTQTAPTTTSAPATTTTAPASTPSSATALEARGHQLMVGGDYAAAIPMLRQAVATASPSSLTYAYALFDLGHALRVSGDPKAAIPILYRRLQIPNQTETVRTELQAALRAVGAQVTGGGGAPAAPKVPPGHARGHGPGDGTASRSD
jgi:eukaryotic-like serine/threonine-protein kinase